MLVERGFLERGCQVKSSAFNDAFKDAFKDWRRSSCQFFHQFFQANVVEVLGTFGPQLMRTRPLFARWGARLAPFVVCRRAQLAARLHAYGRVSGTALGARQRCIVASMNHKVSSTIYNVASISTKSASKPASCTWPATQVH